MNRMCIRILVGIMLAAAPLDAQKTTETTETAIGRQKRSVPCREPMPSTAWGRET